MPPAAFTDLANKRLAEYDRYQNWMPEKDESSKNTLFWEFGKKVAERLSSPKFQFTEPRYDDEFRAAMEKLDSGEL